MSFKFEFPTKSVNLEQDKIKILLQFSVLSGVGVGIRRLSEVCFGLGCVLMMFVMFAEDTWYVILLIPRPSNS